MYSVLLVTLFSGKFLGSLVGLTSCTGFIMMSYIVASGHFSFPLFINSEELIYFQISEVPCLNSQTQFVITFTIEICVVKFMAIVISGLTFM